MANTTNLDLVKPLGTDHALISVINSNMDKIDAYAGKTDDAIGGIADGLAIVTNGDTHVAITSGQFVYVRNHNTLSEGLYVATANIAENGTLSGSNLTADSSGGLNSVYSALNGKIEPYDFGYISLDAFKTAVVTYATPLSINSYRMIKVRIDGSSSPFIAGHLYEGLLKKPSSSAYWTIEFSDPEGNPIYCRYENGTWTIDAFALNSRTAATTAIGIATTGTDVLLPGNVGFVIFTMPRTASISWHYILSYSKQNGTVNVKWITEEPSGVTVVAGVNKITVSHSQSNGLNAFTMMASW